MNIYVDFDDCLCETGRSFSVLASELFGINVPYEEMRYFNLQHAFGLTEEQYRLLLVKGHEPDRILAFEETPGASAVMNEWLRAGHNVSVITGRPGSCYDVSRAWLDNHGLQDIPLFTLDKYGRENGMQHGATSLSLDDYYKMKFDYAVEDSPLAFRFFDHLPDLKVLVFDRPWNRLPSLPGSNYRRCCDWESVRAAALKPYSVEASVFEQP